MTTIASHRHLIRRFAALVLFAVAASAYADAKLELVADVDGKPGYGDGMGFLCLPGQEVSVKITATSVGDPLVIAAPGQSASASTAEQYRWTAERGTLLNVSGRTLTFRCPDEPGTCLLTANCFLGATIKGADGKDTTRNQEATWTMAFFVQYPFDREGVGAIDNYPIGIYPNEESSGVPSSVQSHLAAYTPPEHFVRIGKDERDIRISPHFKLGEFRSPYNENDPTFVAISPRLITRLEALREALTTSKLPEPRLVILRAYISPNEKNMLERKKLSLSEFTRHLYGDAVAIIVDADADGRMDDLNGDGAINVKDADALARSVEETARSCRIFGGVGTYAGATDPLLPDTPFVTFDCRGWAVRY